MKWRHFGVMIGVALVVLTSCSTVGHPGSPTMSTVAGSTASQPVNDSDPSASSSSGSRVTTDLPELATVTVDAAATDVQDSAGGSVTAILRSLEADGDVLTVSFAIQWDNAAQDDGAMAVPASLGLSLRDIMVIDPVSLTGYRPFCTQGSYHGDGPDQVECLNSMLVSPNTSWASDYAFPNHGLIEGFVQLPVPEGRPATVNLTLGSPFPMFNDSAVSYQ
ncbi:MAG: hypothetical protein LBV30_09420 [Propionibacteriaceae bacterium]|jgi:uncharacterized lipoprotein YbaY|nr:hypothetical protein [Propionibacteriaceae bacterium]